MGAANPGACGVTSELIFKDSFHHIDLFAAEVAVWIELRPRSPPHHRGMFGLEFGERQNCESGHESLEPVCLGCVNRAVLLIRGMEVSEFDEQGAARFGTRCMRGAGRVFEIGPRSKAASLIGKNAIQDQYFFTQVVRVALERRARSVSHHRSGAGYFAAIALDHPALNATSRGVDPVHAGNVDHDALRQIRIKFQNSTYGQAGVLARIAGRRALVVGLSSAPSALRV